MSKKLQVMFVLALAVGTLGLAACSTTQPMSEQIDDAAITAAVKAKFAGDPEVSAIDIDVDTNEGVVTLSGRVETADQSREAAKLAADTNGVRRVINNLSVGDRT
jgi:osmotically-inducible protein OsmY